MTHPAHQVGSGIRFNDCIFSEPVSFANWVPPGCPGLFAILTFDPNWAPRPVRPLYFGEFGNNTPAHTLFHQCSRMFSGENGKYLLICVLPMPFTTTTQRCSLRDELVSAYHPMCQSASYTPSNDLAQKVDELERRHQEQNAQMMMLVAGVSRFLEPPPAPPRRRIGFNPLPEPAAS